MNTSTDLVPLPEEQAREAINRWSQGFFRVRYLGDKIFIREIVPCYTYNVRLRTQYEERSVAPVSVPYHGQPLDNEGTPPEPWSISVRRPDNYEDRTETLAIPHTDRVSMCPNCAGVGHIACSRCHGTGQTACSWCHGRGFTERTETRHEHNAQGQPSVRTVTVRANCVHCFHGRVSCTACGGNGRVTCSECEGTTRVRTFGQLTVRFRKESKYEVLDTTDVPDAHFERLQGDPILNRRGPQIEDLSSLPPQVQQCGEQLLGQSRAVDERQSRVLFQDLEIDRVSVHEVQYMYAGMERRLWVYGDGQVHAPGAPWRRGRFIAILAAIGGAILIAIMLFLSLGS